MIKVSTAGRSRSRAPSGSDDVSLAGRSSDLKREKNKEKIGKRRVPFSQDVSVAVISPSLQRDVAANPRGTSPFTLDHLRVSAL